jgi:hypothetical protein
MAKRGTPPTFTTDMSVAEAQQANKADAKNERSQLFLIRFFSRLLAVI